jgi:membrane-associated phospholipid phosphatase
LHTIWSFVTDFGDTAVTVPLAVMVTGFLFAAKQPRLAIGWALVILVCAGVTGAVKLAFTVCGYPLAGSGLMSPSGHTAMSIAVYGGLAAIVGSSLGAPARAALIAAAAIFTIGIALSRTIVGSHTPIEVAVGLVVGVAALGPMIAVVARYRPEHLPIHWLAAGALVVFVLFHGTQWPAEGMIHRVASWLDILRPYCS